MWSSCLHSTNNVCISHDILSGFRVFSVEIVESVKSSVGNAVLLRDHGLLELEKEKDSPSMIPAAAAWHSLLERQVLWSLWNFKRGGGPAVTGPPGDSDASHWFNQTIALKKETEAERAAMSEPPFNPASNTTECLKGWSVWWVWLMPHVLLHLPCQGSWLQEQMQMGRVFTTYLGRFHIEEERLRFWNSVSPKLLRAVIHFYHS